MQKSVDAKLATQCTKFLSLRDAATFDQSILFSTFNLPELHSNSVGLILSKEQCDHSKIETFPGAPALWCHRGASSFPRIGAARNGRRLLVDRPRTCAPAQRTKTPRLVYSVGARLTQRRSEVELQLSSLFCTFASPKGSSGVFLVLRLRRSYKASPR